jgi:thioredoxin reductase
MRRIAAMGWFLLASSIVVLTVVAAWTGLRRAELRRLSGTLRERTRARTRGTHRAQLQHPVVDLSRCVGCGACVRACPEEDVLGLIHGQAAVLHGARCVGHGACARACPTGAIAVTIADLSERRDIPVVDERFEVPKVPGLFLAGEVTGQALIRNAVSHGVAVADEVARRVHGGRLARRSAALDLCIVGAGPAGLACALRAKEQGLDFLLLEQDLLGGTVAKYPRRKLVMTQPLELPLYGRIDATTIGKEELMELWESIAVEAELPVRTGVRVTGTARLASGELRVSTEQGAVDARHVCLALGRRGTPAKLGVPGEHLPKVAYALLDAASYQGRRVLVVGGGDSAVEAALALADQPGNEVALSYRRASFSRLKPHNERRLVQAERARRLGILRSSVVRRIEPQSVELALETAEGSRTHVLANDDVFVFAGGSPPFQMLAESGVSFDPRDRPASPDIGEQGSGFYRALLFALACALMTLAWTAWFRAYYGLSLAARAQSPLHALLRPAGAFGLACGIGALALVVANLAYLARRAEWPLLRRGSLQVWMTSHLVTGLLALCLALLHAAMAPRDTSGGHALWAMSVLVVTGAIGRYLYAFVPRAANGRELALEEARSRVALLSAEWDRTAGAPGAEVRAAIDGLSGEGRWRVSFARRAFALLRARRRMHRAVDALRRDSRRAGLSADQIAALVQTARRAELAALAAARYEELRGLLSTWRGIHRAGALVLVVLVLLHVVLALRFGGIVA